MADCVDGRKDRGDERIAKRIAQYFRRMADAEQLAGGRVITSAADPVLTLCEKHRKAWTLANDSPDSDAFDVAEGIDLEIAKTAATTIDGVLNQARLMSQWNESGDWPDARMAMIGHSILEGLKLFWRV